MPNYPKDMKNDQVYDVKEVKTGSGTPLAGYGSSTRPINTSVKSVVTSKDRK